MHKQFSDLKPELCSLYGLEEEAERFFGKQDEAGIGPNDLREKEEENEGT